MMGADLLIDQSDFKGSGIFRGLFVWGLRDYAQVDMPALGNGVSTL